ncbi:MAG TPA: MEDS domain-containing protein [Verrucomicrobiae bacterium]|jgi:signal transduction histidine kinase|nr:MEDS domain-containing protein [Verrucomicrobiae bacterium]
MSPPVELRKTGISPVGDLPWGTHFCQFFQTKQDLLDILVPYFRAGLEHNEMCVWSVFDPLDEKEARDALGQVVPNLSQRIAAGDMQIVHYREWYLEGGAFDERRVTDRWKEQIVQARAKGYSGLRVSGSAAWLTSDVWKDFAEYEQHINDVVAREPMMVLCTYPLKVAGATELLDVTRSHEFAVARRQGSWEILETRALKKAKRELQELTQHLEQRVLERSAALAAANEDLRATSEKLRALSARVQSLREEEGARIAREIHDELGSALTSLKWDLEEVHKQVSEGKQPSLPVPGKKLESMIKLTDTTIDTVRRIASELRPSILDDLGLLEAVEWQAQQFQARTGIICHCKSRVDTIDLDLDKSTAIFRIFQEALTNVARHAQASRVDILLDHQAGEFVLRVRDNGRGITEEEKSKGFSLGLLGMRERAHLIGGKILVTGEEGEGTIVVVRVPAPPPGRDPDRVLSTPGPGDEKNPDR